MSQESSNHELPKAYDPSVIEERWAEYWVKERLFDVPTAESTHEGTTKFTILLPPPNVTGRLHMGHMLNQTEMDILTRWHRMLGETALWLPGTDHAGIATQMMVERQLKEEGTTRQQMGREAFVQRVWCWRKLYGGAILDQMKRLGASVDWDREYFTMDDRLSIAVEEAFVRLYEQGLIYRGAYIVNWDPSIQTAVSDLEVEHEERLGKLYLIRYPLAGATAPFDEKNSITVATTRPETMLGDTAVAVNPTDERYTALIGKKVRVPLTEINGNPAREVPILADDWAKPEFGTGAVKVTPAHDPNDFAIGQRHNLPSPSILDQTAHIDLPGSPYHGLDRYAARERIVADLEAAGLLVAVKDHTNSIGLSQRTGVVIEPRLSMQWFLAVNKTPSTGGNTIAKNAIDAVTEKPHQLHAGDVQKNLPRVDDEHSRLVHLPPALVGTPHSRMALPVLQQNHRSPRHPARLRHCNSTESRRRPTSSTPGSPPACFPSPPSAGPNAAKRHTTSLPTSPPSTPPPSSSPASTSSSSGSPA